MALAAGAFLTQKRVAPVLNEWSINLDLVYNAKALLSAGFEGEMAVQYTFGFGFGNLDAAEHYPDGKSQGEVPIEHPNNTSATFTLSKTQPIPYEMKPTFFAIRIVIRESVAGNVNPGLPFYSEWEQVPLNRYTDPRVVPGP